MKPLQPDVFYVDNTIVELITTCPWLAYASVIRRRRPTDESAALRFGGFIHQALDYRYKQIGLGQSWSEGKMITLLDGLFRNTPLETEGWRNFDTAVKVVRAYNRRYCDGQDFHKISTNPKTGLPYVEQPFACDTGKVIRSRRIIYIGRIDLKIIEPDHSTFIVDTKTSSVLGDQTWADWAISEQFRGYCWADRECTGEEPTGYVINAIGARDSIANAMFNEVTGQVEPISAKSKAVPLELVRQPFFTRVPGGQLDEWFEGMLNKVDMFLYLVDKCGDNPVLWETHRHHKHCIGKYGPCRFYNVCSLPRESREDALMSSGFKEDDWTPLYL